MSPDEIRRAADYLRESRECVLRTRRNLFSLRDQDGTRAAIALDVHALGCDDLPQPERSRVAAHVEGWLSDLGMRR